MASSWQNVQVDGSKMPLYLSTPESGGPVPGIVVVHGQSGLENFIKDTTHMLALQGYAAAAPNLYHRDGPDCKDENSVRKARLRDPSIIRDIEGVIAFLKSHPRVNPGRGSIEISTGAWSGIHSPPPPPSAPATGLTLELFGRG